MKTRVRRVILLLVGGLGISALAAADTLVLRNGRRVEGELVGVRSGVLEFRSSGWSGRTERYDVSEVRSVEFDRRGGYDERDDDRNGRDEGGGFGRPRGLRERSVSVDARAPWTDTGVELRRGQEVYFEASGRVRWGKDRQDGPAGERNSPRNPGRPIPNRPGAALIGRIDNGDPFFIGDDQGAIRVRDGGRLQLGINDDYLQDNSGALRVTVYY